MKCAIIYASVHHGNTYKLVEAIAKENPEVEVFDSTKVILKDLSGYDLIGIASGIYFSKFHKSILPFLKSNLPEGKKIFIMYTSGARQEFGDDIMPVINERNCSVIGSYKAIGFDTFGPFKLVGGLNKNHPDADEIQGAVDFYKEISK